MNTPTRIGYLGLEPICDHCAKAEGVFDAVQDWGDDPDSAPTCATCGLGLAYFDIGGAA